MDRSLAPRQRRYAREVEALVGAALRVMRREGYAAATVAAVLTEAGLCTRAFYRHFRSRDELFLAVFERDSEAASARMRRHLAQLAGPRARLEGWIDEMLSHAFDPRRARRTRVLAHEAPLLRHAHPEEFGAIQRAAQAPLVAVLEAGLRDGSFPEAHPEADARSIHALIWSLVEARLAGGGPDDPASARAQVLRYCLPALGAAPGPDDPAAAAPEPRRNDP